MTEACPMCGNPLGSPDCYRKASVIMAGPPTDNQQRAAEQEPDPFSPGSPVDVFPASGGYVVTPAKRSPKADR